MAEDARACPNCGFLAVRGPLRLQPGDGVADFIGLVFCVGLGAVCGLFGGVFLWSWLAGALSTLSPSHVSLGEFTPSLQWNWWVGLVMVGTQSAFTVPLLLGGLQSFRRGHRAEGLLLISFGIGLALPAAACDAGYAFPKGL